MTQVRPMLAASKYKKAGDLWGPAHEAIVARHLSEDGFLIVEPKWDGFRFIHHDGIPMSRSGEPLANHALQRFVTDHPELAGIDGELLPGGKYTDASFRLGMSQLRSRDGAGEMTVAYYDCIREPKLEYLERLELAASILGRDQQEPVCEKPVTFEGDGYSVTFVQCPYVVVTTMEQLFEAEAEFIAAKYEGAIVRRPRLPYKYNRATVLGGELVKMKRGRPSYDARVEGYEEGEQNTNEAQTSALGFTKRSSHKEGRVPNGRLGALIIRWVNGPYVGKTQKVGVFRGLSHGDLMALLTEAKDGKLEGRYCEVSVDGATGGYELARCPVWLRWRDASEFPA